MSLTESLVTEADLHAFVDGRLTVDRRADVLRLLASSRSDRVMIEAWQDQNDALRGAFAGVEREALPPTLNLAPLPYLRLADPIAPEPDAARSRQNGRMFAVLATAAVIIAGFAGAWTLSDGAGDGIVDAGTRTSIEEGLARRAIAALTSEDDATRAAGYTGGGLPTTTIPDLSRVGFGLVRAEMTGPPASLVFHYLNAASDRVVISVAQAATTRSSLAPARVGGAWSWRRLDKTYALAGTIPASRLRALAATLRDGEGVE